MWPSTGITKNVLKYCLNREVALASASTVLMADMFAIESLKQDVEKIVTRLLGIRYPLSGIKVRKARGVRNIYRLS